MVARIVTGKKIKGAVNYNEEKVRAGKATLILAENYLKPAEQLSLQERLGRLSDLAKMNERVKTNCVHVSLNFEPGESLSNEKLARIAKEYMNQLGFSHQPFLVYRHEDAAHPHIHIVTTNIQPGGIRIPLHNIGVEKSEPIRKAIEQKFGLVQAEGRGKKHEPFLQPIELEKAVYGKSETKSAISKIVRSVVRSYDFTSLAELNAVLGRFNVVADGGEPGSKLQEKRGLVYSMLDKDGNKTGVPIKASSIYTTPTLSRLEERFAAGKEKRTPLKKPLKAAIDKVLEQNIKGTAALAEALAKVGVDVVFRQNAGRIYGTTFVDHRSKAVFKGSDLGTGYSTAQLLERMGKPQSVEGKTAIADKAASQILLDTVDYSKGAASAVAQIYSKGGRLTCDSEGRLSLSSAMGNNKNTTPLSAKMQAYFRLHHITREVINGFHDLITGIAPGSSQATFTSLLGNLLQKQAAEQAFFVPRPKKKRRRH